MYEIDSLQKLEAGYPGPVSERAFYQCRKALAGSRLRDPQAQVERGKLPGAGRLARFFSAAQGAEPDADDENYPARLEATPY